MSTYEGSFMEHLMGTILVTEATEYAQVAAGDLQCQRRAGDSRCVLPVEHLDHSWHKWADA